MDDVFSIFQKKKKRATTSAPNEENTKRRSLINPNRTTTRRAHHDNYDGSSSYSSMTDTTSGGKGRNKQTNSNEIDNIVTAEFPALPNKNPESCVSFYYIQYLRNQLIYGNRNIQIDENIKSIAESLLDKIESDIYESENSEEVNDKYKKDIKTIIFKSIFDRYYKIYTTFITYAENIPLPNNLYEYALSNGVYIRSKKNEDFNCRENIHNIYAYLDNVEVGENDLSVNSENIFIDTIDISKPTIINKALINLDIDIEYLPLKFNSSYFYNNLQCAKIFLNDSINLSIYDKALGELVVVKALVDIPEVPIEYIEGFDIKEMKAGERLWMPIYIAISLSSFSYIDVEFPFWFYIKNFIHIKEEEYKHTDLFELPSPYFFEICYMFIDQKVFTRATPIETVGQKSYFKYMAKVAGYVEDIKHCRTEKIIRILEEQNVHSTHICIPNLQYSETHLINLSLYSFWKYDNSFSNKTSTIDITSYLLEPFIEKENEEETNLLEDL